MDNELIEEKLKGFQLQQGFKAEQALLSQTIGQLEADRKKIIELENFRDSLTHMLVHDIKNPLACISSALELLNMLQSGFTDEQKKCVDNAAACVKRINNLTADILDVKKLEENKLELRKTRFPAAQLLEMLSPYFDAARKEKKSITAAAEESINLAADKSLIFRVLENLFSNSLKYTPAGGSIGVNIRKEGPQILFEIRDSGAGIPAEYLPKIFEKFFMVEAGREKARPGYGLGLTFCKLAVEAHGGTIGVESEPGKGSRFYFYLPGSATDK